MTETSKNVKMKKIPERGKEYIKKLSSCFKDEIYANVELMSNAIELAWIEGKNVYLCGNGGSAANAMHISNDFIYGIGECGPDKEQKGVKVEALTANSAIMSCLANDTGYENIFSKQLETKGQRKDILITLSGSGNSSNIINAIKMAHSLEMIEFSIVAFDGGICKQISRNCIHFQVDDMQIAEDTQLIVGHMIMQYLSENRDAVFLK